MINSKINFRYLIADTNFSNVFTVNINSENENSSLLIDPIENLNDPDQFVIKIFKEHVDINLIKKELYQLDYFKNSLFIEKQIHIQNQNYHMILFEFYSNGTLENILINNNYKYQMIKQLIIKFVEIIKYLEKHNLIHRDFKLSNLMIDKNYNIKLIDQGSVLNYSNFKDSIINNQKETIQQSKIEESETLNSLHQTPYESVCDNFIASNYDIQSLGVCIQKLIHKKQPQSNQDDSNSEYNESYKDLIKNMKNQNIIKIDDDLPQQLKLILNGALNKDYKLRISLKEISKLLEEMDLNFDKNVNQIKLQFENRFSNDPIFEHVQTDDVIDVEDFEQDFDPNCFVFKI